ARRAAERAAAAAEADAALDALTLDTIGVALSHGGDHARAAVFFERAAAKAPEANILHNLGVARQFTGDLAGAAEAFRAELALQPEGRRPYAALVHLEKQTRQANFIPELEAQFARAEGDANAQLQIGHALAKSFEDLGEAQTAFAWLVRAKAAKKRESPYAPEAARALMRAAVEAYRAAPAGSGHPSDAPIFIVGMPRTGTTLLDRVLSGHPAIVSAGELSDFPALAADAGRAAADPPLTDESVMRATARIDAAALGAAYERAARARIGPALRFIDKMPVNALHAGLIHRALPQARIICLRRHPMDACLSNFRQIFGPEAAHYWYAFDLEWTAHYYVAFDALMAQWRALLPADRFTEVAYEALVGDLEGEARRLISFCGLPWDDRCLAPHENASPVATASAVQVRAPVHARSVGRWRAYEAALEPVAAILRAAGVWDGT
ncbi:MAG: sulfotransferase, partial [Hydrogenophilaceae bacterium]|nr:sulfotransferase [Hydrogenophilaceae bacterium]